MPFRIQIKYWTITVPRDKEFGNSDTAIDVLKNYLMPAQKSWKARWEISPKFQMRDQYGSVDLAIDDKFYGSSPEDFKAEPQQVINVLNWIKARSDTKNDVIGKKFELIWPRELVAAFSFMEITYVNLDTGYITNVVRGKNAPSGILDGSFKYQVYNQASDNPLPYMIRDGMYLEENFHVKESWGSTNQQLNKELNVHQVSDVDLIWKNNQRQTNHQDVFFSIWRAMKIKGYFNPGDIISPGHASPGVGFLLKGNPKSTLNHFKLPDSYDIVFDSEDIGFIDSLCCIWKLNCPPSYVALGFVAKVNCTEPEMGDAYCVHHSLTSNIENWDDRFYGASPNKINWGELRQARVNNGQFDMLQMGAYMNWNYQNEYMNIPVNRNNPSVTYAINRSSGNFWTEKPILYTTIGDVTYDFNNMAVKANPTELNSAFLENYSHIPQTVTRTLSYTDEKSFEFDMGHSIAEGINVEVEISIEIPIPSTTITLEIGIETAVSYSTSTSWENGKAAIASQTKSITAAMEIPDSHKMEVVVVANKFETTVPYSATLTKKFYDGTSEKMKISGNFKGSVCKPLQVEFLARPETL